jgi:uncharacterized membrane protein
MTDIESLLARWQAAGVMDAETAARVRAHEAQTAMKVASESLEEETAGIPTSQSRVMAHPATDLERVAGHPGREIGLHWQGITALIFGAILLASGVVLFVSAHWDEMGPGARYTLVCVMVAVFHVAGGIARKKFLALSTALHAVGTIATGAAIALVGQIFNIQGHWPGAVLLWALAALAGWMLLRDQAQETLALLLAPAWIISEIGYRAGDHIGSAVYVGRLCFVWGILYITFFLGSRQRAVQGILFAASAIAAVVGVVLMLTAWQSWSATQSFLPFGLRVWAWVAIAGVPLVVGAFRGHKGLVPIAAAIAFVIALPWCYHTKAQTITWGNGHTASYTQTTPDLLAHVLVTGFALFLCWWGVRLVSRALVNLGVVAFAASVGWFYFSDIMDKMGRSLGLIGLGVLFLVGGWALERMRRRMLAGIGVAQRVSESAN